MSGIPVYTWLAVNAYMQDQYRETVVDVALGHLRHASRDLRAFAKQELARAVTIPGFRSYDRAPANLAKRHVAMAMTQDAGTATAVMCLWAEAKQEVINTLKAATEAKGHQLRPDWPWQEARQGFYDFEDIPHLVGCADALIEDSPSSEADHLRLATLWLSRALILDPHPGTVEIHPAVPSEDVSYQTKPVSPDQLLEPAPRSDVQFVGTLQELAEFLQERVSELRQACEVAVSEARAVLVAAEVSDLTKADAQLVVLQSALATWQDKQDLLVETVRRAKARLADELELRPDLELDASTASLLHGEMTTNKGAEAAAKSMLSAVKVILEYNSARRDTLDHVAKIRAHIVELHEDISIWPQDESPDMPTPLYPESDELEITLTEARATLDQITLEKHKFEDLRSHLRASSLSRIATLVNRLEGLDSPSDTIVSEDLTLSALTTADIADMRSNELWSIEQKLSILLSEQMMMAELTAPEVLATELQDEWDEDKLVDLLKRLARDKRDVEALLLLLAANATHPRSRVIHLVRPVVASLLRGVGQLSSKMHPFELLNLLAPDFLNGWEAADQASQAELCLVFLAAQYDVGRRLPEGFLWQVHTEWPLGEMPNWNKLWQRALLDEPLPIARDVQDDDLPNRLEQTRDHATQMLAREHGLFVRLGSLRSSRHQSLLSSELMPNLLSHLQTLQGI